ncbi:MAG: DUF5686 family protein, partial [Bacteroidia bacterium]|nr:DUF5686 family protein [Bacteroidia bacterium]
ASFLLANKKRLTFYPTLRYGFANQKLSYKLGIRYNLGARSRGTFEGSRSYIEFIAGDYIQFFGIIEQIEPALNTYYTLFEELNFLRLYQKKFFTLNFQHEISNGLNARFSLNYEYRTSMPNRTSQTWFPKPNREYKPNIEIPTHQALITDFYFTYQPANRYITTPDGKLNIGSQWPTFFLLYRKGWNTHLLGNTAFSSFDLLEIGTRYRISLKMLGKTRMSASLGKFFSTQEIYFPDYYHFKGNQTALRNPTLLEQFSILSYYFNSTAQTFLQSHIEHNFGGFLFNKIPGIRNLKLQEIVGLHYAYTIEKGNYAEICAGIGNLFRVFQLDFHFRLLGDSFTPMAFTIGTLIATQ